METYVVKEIREYEESILMGLNKRQLLCSALAIVSAVGIYFGFRQFVLQDLSAHGHQLCRGVY